MRDGVRLYGLDCNCNEESRDVEMANNDSVIVVTMIMMMMVITI